MDFLDYIHYKRNYGWIPPGLVPEPATLLLLAAGLAGMLRRRSRRRLRDSHSTVPWAR